MGAAPSAMGAAPSARGALFILSSRGQAGPTRSRNLFANPLLAVDRHGSQMCYRRREPSLRSRGLIAVLALYGPGAVYPPSRYREYHPSGYSSPPDYYDPYEYESPRVYRQRRPPVEVDWRGPDAPSRKKSWRRFRPLRVGRVRSDLS